MLIERRRYALRPGNLEKFWDAQVERGTDPEKRPIMARLIGYFSSLTGTRDEIVHLYRYDGYDDWFARLHGSYRNPANDSYFRTVRPLMASQGNEFLLPAPVPRLAALIGEGRSWLPADGPRWHRPEGARPVVGETVYQLRPGLLKELWSQVQESPGDPQVADLIGCFCSHVGEQHRIYVYRVHRSLVHVEDDDPGAAALDRAVRPHAESVRRRWLAPSPVAGLSPLFGYSKA